jgi:acetyl esterase
VHTAPATAESFTGLPSAMVVTAGHDPLRDDGEAYAALLEWDGVPVTSRRFDNMVHGFASFDGVVPATTAAVDECLAVLRDALRARE